MTLDGEPFRRSLSLKSAIRKVNDCLRSQQVSNVTISGRAAL